MCVYVCLENGCDGRRNRQVSIITAIINNKCVCNMLFPIVILTVFVLSPSVIAGVVLKNPELFIRSHTYYRWWAIGMHWHIFHTYISLGCILVVPYVLVCRQ